MSLQAALAAVGRLADAPDDSSCKAEPADSGEILEFFSH